MNNDEELWQGMMQGDKDMFLALYKKHYHSLLFVGLKEIKDSQLVKDTIQQLYLYLWEKRETLGAAKNVKSYSSRRRRKSDRTNRRCCIYYSNGLAYRCAHISAGIHTSPCSFNSISSGA